VCPKLSEKQSQTEVPSSGCGAGGGGSEPAASSWEGGLSSFVELLERHRLGADVPAAEGIRLIAADGGDAACLHLGADAAHGLVEVA
jgi:hypothetical protein